MHPFCNCLNCPCSIMSYLPIWTICDTFWPVWNAAKRLRYRNTLHVKVNKTVHCSLADTNYHQHINVAMLTLAFCLKHHPVACVMAPLFQSDVSVSVRSAQFTTVHCHCLPMRSYNRYWYPWINIITCTFYDLMYKNLNYKYKLRADLYWKC